MEKMPQMETYSQGLLKALQLLWDRSLVYNLNMYSLNVYFFHKKGIRAEKYLLKRKKHIQAFMSFV